MRLLIIIPAFNEKDNIERCIHSLDEIGRLHPDILVVNDGSADETGVLAEQTEKAVVINLSSNLGIGGAVQTGFMYAHRHGYDCAIQFDGDGQHKAEEIPRLLGPIERGEADVVVGSRFSEKHKGFRSTYSRRLGIKFFNLLNRLIIRQNIKDNTSGFRAYNRPAIALLAENYPCDFPEPEAIIILGKNGFRIQEIFTEMQERISGNSSIFGLNSIYYMIKVTLSILVSGIRPKIKPYEKSD